MKRIASLALATLVLIGSAACSDGKNSSSSDLSSSSGETQFESETLVWSAPTTKKYTLNEKPLSETLDLSIVMCKNETEGVQLMITPNENVTSYDVTIGDLTDGKNIISKDKIGVYREHYLYMSQTNHSSTVGYYPDPLVPMSVSKEAGENVIAKGQNQGVLIEVTTEAGTPSGEYKGTVTLTLNGEKQEIPLTVSVKDVTLPQTHNAKRAFAIWDSELSLGTYSNVGYREYMHNAYELLLDYGISPTDLPNADYLSTEEQIELAIEYANRDDVTCFSLPYAATSVNAEGYAAYVSFDYAHLKTLLSGLIKASANENNLLKKVYLYLSELDEQEPDAYWKLRDTNARLDYIDLVQRFVSQTMKKIVDKVHAAGKEAMMFWGDNWIGAEPYGKYFAEIGLDAVVGSVSSGATVRAVSDIPALKYREIRLMPYFFPDTLNDDEAATNALMKNWAIERRALLRKPVERVGFGGYLKLADKLPRFCAAVENLCDEFRMIYDTVANKQPFCSVKVAILSYWGAAKAWQTYMICQDAPYQRLTPYLGMLEALAGLPVELRFISFEDAKNGKLSEFDVVINGGNGGTSFSGDVCWKDGALVECVREYIANGGGFIGVGEPSAVLYGGRYFQLADALGVDKETGLSLPFNRYNVQKQATHFITEDLSDAVDYAHGTDHVFAREGVQVLDVAYSDDLPKGVNNGHVKMAVNTYGKGRCFYLAGLKYNATNTRLFYRALLWCAGKEASLRKAFSSNVHTECHYYPESKKYALVNNTAEKQTTVFYDVDGKQTEYTLKESEILWIGAK